MAVDLAGCDRMLAPPTPKGSADRRHQRRLHNRYIRARELIDTGAIGDLVQITGYGGGDLLTGARTPWTSSATWCTIPRRSGYGPD
jgi:predicted dehydrogenase